MVLIAMPAIIAAAGSAGTPKLPVASTSWIP
jgi:hypothetical protein